MTTLSNEQQAALRLMNQLVETDALPIWQRRVDNVLAQFVYLMTQNKNVEDIGAYQKSLETLGLLHDYLSDAVDMVCEPES